MSKKIIAVLIVLTMLFMTVFAACNSDNEEERVYVEKDEYDFVTDENGERVLNKDGEFLVYETDDKGKRVKDDNGEYITLAQPFEPIEDGNVIENYGYKFNLPEGWKTTNQPGEFVNEKTQQSIEVDVLKYTYPDYYNKNIEMYQQLKSQGYNVKWEDSVDLGADFTNAARFTLQTEEGVSIMYFFVNSGNLYKLLFNAVDPATAVADSEALCKVIDFKPFTYYDDITSIETTTAATQTSAEASESVAQ
ncbi:MAG: hypothetical protein J6D06_05455 [Clostridia bacterium]|nr:hypothetical protein [Clostridia bacterium]